MKIATRRWAVGAAFGLIVSAVGISIATEQAFLLGDDDRSQER